MMPIWLVAGLWGLLSASGLVLGAVGAQVLPLSHRGVAYATAFGSGVLVAILSLGLVADAVRQGGLVPAALGVVVGATAFSAVNWWLSKRGAHDRKRCGECVEQPTEAGVPGSGAVIAAGSVIDGVPEAFVLGLTVAAGGAPSLAFVAGFFLAGVPEGLSASAGMWRADRSKRYVYSLWAVVVAVSGAAAVAGRFLGERLSSDAVAVVTAVASGALLAMLVETMIPEAFADAPVMIGLITAIGFLTGVGLVTLGG